MIQSKSTIKDLAILASGNGTNAQAIIDACQQGDIPARVALIVSNRSQAGVLARAAKAGIETLVTEDYALLSKEFLKRQIDLIILAGYLKILPAFLISSFKNRIVNIHPSLIPAFAGKDYYGIRVHEAVHEKGVRYTGATTHFVTEEADAGPIIFQDIVKIGQEDMPGEIQKKVLEIEHPLLIKTIKYFCEDRLTVDKNKVYVEE